MIIRCRVHKNDIDKEFNFMVIRNNTEFTVFKRNYNKKE